MQKSIGDSLTDNGYVDLFGGLGEDKQGVLIKALTDKLVDSPLNLTFSITEIDEQNGKTEITHNANTYVTQKTAYAGYKSSKGVQEMKVKIDYTSIEQLLPSIINLLQIDIDQYPALDKLAQSVGVDSKEGVIKSEVLQSLFGGVFDKNDLSFETDTDLLAKDTVKKAVKKIVWTDDEITIWLDNNVLYGDGISQTQKNGYLTVIVKKAVGGDLTIELKNVHGSDTKTLNLEIGVKSTDQATINGLSGYMDFSSINQIYADIANTASFGEYHLNGTINLNIDFGIGGADVKIPVDAKITLDENNNLKQMYAKLTPDYTQKIKLLGIPSAAIYDETTKETVTDSKWWGDCAKEKEVLQYIEVFYNPTGINSSDHKVYFRKTYKKYNSTRSSGVSKWKDTYIGETYEHAALDPEQMSKQDDPTFFVMDYVYYCLPFNTNVMNLKINLRQIINDQIKNKSDPDAAAVIENILTSFGYANSKYALIVNPARLIGDGRFSDTMTIELNRSPVFQAKPGSTLQSDVQGTPHILKSFKFETKVVSIVTLGADLNLANYNGSTVTTLKNWQGLLPESLNSMRDLGGLNTVR